MKPNESQVDEFFATLPEEDKTEVDIFDDKQSQVAPVVESPVVDADDPESAPESVKDRRHRRLEARLQAERETTIALNERIKTLSEMDKFSKEAGDIIIPDIAKMFSSDEVGKENALRLSKIILDSKTQAKEEAIREIEERRVQEIQEQKKYENLIDNELENLEDQYEIDLTSDAPKARKMRREFLELVQELSPKDENGDITGYADFESAFGMYQRTQVKEEKTNTRREEISARSMQRSTTNTENIPTRTPGFNGWKVDMERGSI